MAIVLVITSKAAAVKTAAVKYGIDCDTFNKEPKKLELNGNMEKISKLLDEVGVYSFRRIG